MFSQINLKKITPEQKIIISILATVFIFSVIGSIAINNFSFKIAENGDFLKQYFNIGSEIPLTGKILFLKAFLNIVNMLL